MKVFGNNLWFIYIDKVFFGIGEMSDFSSGLVISSILASKIPEGTVLHLDAFRGTDALIVEVTECVQGERHILMLKKQGERPHQYASLPRLINFITVGYFISNGDT